MKALMRLLGLVLILYLTAVGYMYVKQRDLLFVRDAHPGPLDGFWFQATPDTRIWIDRLNPGQPRALLYFPGNTTSDWDDAKRLSTALPHHTLYFVRYRGYANSDGEPSQDALYADALALFDAIKPKHKTVDIMGRSLGTGMAVYTAARRTGGKLLLTTPYDGILIAAQKAYPWLPVSLILKDPFPSKEFAPEIDEQTEVILAKGDQKIPNASSENLIKAFKNKPEVIVLRGTTHSAVVRHPLYLKTLQDFFEK